MSRVVGAARGVPTSITDSTSGDGAQGAELLDVVRPRRAVPVHVDDYAAFKSPLSAFTDEMDRRGLGELVRVVGRGETVTFD